MRYSLTILERDYLSLRQNLIGQAPNEGAGYILCGESRTAREVRLLATQIHYVSPEDYLVKEPDRLSIRSQSYAAIAKLARRERMGVIFVHSHPRGAGTPSFADDLEEPLLSDFFSSRLPGKLNGCMVIGQSPEASVRIWIDGSWRCVDRIRVLGNRYRFLDSTLDLTDEPAIFERQVRAFGPALQSLLGRLHVGVVGVGGTGSAVAEMLARLGIGDISLFDHDPFELTNVTRVIGSTSQDVGTNKALLGQRHIEGLGLGTKVKAYQGSICHEKFARRLRECDIVFGCTDVEAPRAILVALALQYLVPVIDMGVKISSDNGTIKSIDGRITTLLAGQPCLFCRQRISAKRIGEEGLPDNERRGLIHEGYAEGLDTHDPAVISFTNAVASHAVTNMLLRLTGVIEEEFPTETILLFHFNKVLHPRAPVDNGCICKRQDIWGRGDTTPFLGLVWPEQSNAPR
jgi:hypothetical protein